MWTHKFTSHLSGGPWRTSEETEHRCYILQLDWMLHVYLELLTTDHHWKPKNLMKEDSNPKPFGYWTIQSASWATGPSMLARSGKSLISLLLHSCNFCFDFQLPCRVTGAANSHLATNTLPSFVTWETAMALDVQWLPRAIKVLLQSHFFKNTLFLNSPSPNCSWPHPYLPQLPPGLSSRLNLERDIEIYLFLKERKRFGGWLLWTHCAPSEHQLKVTVGPVIKAALILRKHQSHWIWTQTIVGVNWTLHRKHLYTIWIER